MLPLLMLMRGFLFIVITIFLYFCGYHISNSSSVWFGFCFLLCSIVVVVAVVRRALLRFKVVVAVVVVCRVLF